MADPEKTGFIVDELARREGSVERIEGSVSRLYQERLISEETAGRYVTDLDRLAPHS